MLPPQQRISASLVQQNGSRVPLLALPELHDPLDARVADDHAGLPIAQDGDDARVVVGCLAEPCFPAPAA